MEGVQFCIYGCGGSHRTDWKNAASTPAGDFVACDDHENAGFLKDVEKLKKANVKLMADLPEAKAEPVKA